MKRTIAAIAALFIAAFSVMPVSALAGSSRQQGDVNNDGLVNVSDIAMIAAHIKGIKPLSAIDRVYADRNGDNRVDVADLSRMAAYLNDKDIYAAVKTRIDKYIEDNEIDADTYYSYKTGDNASGFYTVSVVLDAEPDQTDPDKGKRAEAAYHAIEDFVDTMDLNGVYVDICIGA